MGCRANMQDVNNVTSNELKLMLILQKNANDVSSKTFTILYVQMSFKILIRKIRLDKINTIKYKRFKYYQNFLNFTV